MDNTGRPIVDENERKYLAAIDGVEIPFQTLTEARQWAESYGTTANSCHVYARSGRLVAAYHRDPNGDGTRWYKGG